MGGGMKKESMLASYLLFSGLGFGNISSLLDSQTEKSPYDKLGNGFELRPLDENDKHEYSHLYKDGVKISNEVFRRGGMCSGFKEGYCQLIHYNRMKDKKKYPEGFDWGTHVIINEKGEVAMRAPKFDSIYHLGGNVASIKDVLYNLLTGEPIIYYSSSRSVNGANNLIIEHRYSFEYMRDKVDVPTGVYSLNKITCELTKIDDIR